MNLSTAPKLFSLLLFAGSLIVGCKKDLSNNQIAINDDQDESSVIVETQGDTTILSLKPGLKDGQDSYVSGFDDLPADSGTTNLNSVNEILASKFYYYGRLTTQRGYIRFDSLLTKVPATATIISARLYLYGRSSSPSFPYGNSFYPGSPNPENSCWIQRVVGKTWKESTITWANKSNTTTIDQATLPASNSQWNYNAVADITAIVKSMVSLQKNLGFCMRMKTEQPFRAIEFMTSESSDVTLRPKLVIRYQ